MAHAMAPRAEPRPPGRSTEMWIIRLPVDLSQSYLHHLLLYVKIVA
jgi:hypothetical protein